MKIAHNHLSNLIIEKPSIEELSDKLFQLGHEHEIYNNIYDFEFTPNRGDCLSLRGLLRDLNLFYDTKIDLEIHEAAIKDFKFKFVNNASDLCQNISFLKIDIDNIPLNYNDKLKDYFEDLGVNKNNFFTDVSNYISYETGQPTHCYDAMALGNYLKLELTKENIEFNTLLDNKITLDGSNLVFFDKNNQLVNLAGVIGGKKTSCKTHTKSVIIECANFNSEIIIGKSVKYLINSEAAHKFERNVDPACHNYVLRRFIQIVQEHASIINVELYKQENYKNNTKIIKLDFKKINQIIGANLDKEDCIKYLADLGFYLDGESISVPSHRLDIFSLNDLAEEIARAVGYDNIKPKKFKIITDHQNNDTNLLNENKIKNLLIDNGFYEVINDPFTLDFNTNSIEIDNPLDSNKKFLRTTLKESLLENLLYNQRRQKDNIKLFEISNVYSSKSPNGIRVLGIIASGRVDKNYQDFAKVIDKKYLSNVLSTHICENDNLNIYDISGDLKDSKFKKPIIYLEVELDNNFNVNYSVCHIKKNNLDYTYTPVSRFPSSTRDLSFSIKDFSKCKPLEDYILNFEDELLKEVFIFDYFQNTKNNEIKIGFRLVFQSVNSTITESEITKIIDAIIKHAYTLGVSIPGLN